MFLNRTMDRKKAKEKGKYVDKLDAGPRARYLDKLSVLNGFDPYEYVESEWQGSFRILSIKFLDFPLSKLRFSRQINNTLQPQNEHK